MPMYELTIRYESPNDQAAMAAGIRMETELRNIPGRGPDVPAVTVERLCRVAVTRAEYYGVGGRRPAGGEI